MNIEELMKKQLNIIVFLLIIISYVSNSQVSGTSQTFSLSDCLEIAGQNNTEMILANAKLLSSSAAVTSAFGEFLPSINFNMGYNRQLKEEGTKTINVGGQIITTPGSDPNSYSMSAYASYPIFTGFSREANYNLAQTNLDYYKRIAEYTQSKVKLDVYRQYYEVIKKQQVVKIRRTDLELGQKELEKIQATYEAGKTHIGYVYSQEAEVGSRELALLTAENDLNNSKAVLLTTMGLSSNMQANFLESSIPNSVKENQIDDFRKEIGSFDACINTALTSRIDYAASFTGIEASKSNVTIAQSGYYPTLSASGGWSWTNHSLSKFSELGNSYIGLNLSVPIFENFRTNNQIESAKYQLKQQEIQHFQLEQNIKTAIQTALLNLETSEKQLDITERVLRSSEMNYNIYNERFNIGLSNINEYYDANTRYITAQINRINAIYSYYLAQKEVQFAIGKLN